MNKQKYSDITFDDPSLAKRWLQTERMKIILNDLTHDHSENFSILDYGCGNAELAKHLPLESIKYTGYDPSTEMIEEALQNISGNRYLLLTDKLVDIDKKKYDRICCLEVFEHLTDEAINLILDDFHRMLTDDGFIIIGVPNEIYLAALIRGLFRMSRRFGSYDAKLINIVCATFGIPPKDRPWKGDSPRSTYASPHMGFDHRELRVLLSNRFCITKVYGSPFKHLPLLFNTEVYFILKKSSN